MPSYFDNIHDLGPQPGTGLRDHIQVIRARCVRIRIFILDTCMMGFMRYVKYDLTLREVC